MGYAKEYATAYFDVLLERKIVEESLDELSLVAEAIEGDQAFKQLFEHPKLTQEEKKQVIDQVFGKMSLALKHFLYVLIDNHRLQDIQMIYLAFCDIYKDYHKLLDVQAVTAEPLSNAQKKQLEEKLSIKYRKKINIINEVDPKVIGGIRLNINNEVLDHSVSRHLQNLKSFILKQN